MKRENATVSAKTMANVRAEWNWFSFLFSNEDECRELTKFSILTTRASRRSLSMNRLRKEAGPIENLALCSNARSFKKSAEPSGVFTLITKQVRVCL